MLAGAEWSTSPKSPSLIMGVICKWLSNLSVCRLTTDLIDLWRSGPSAISTAVITAKASNTRRARLFQGVMSVQFF